MAKKQDSSFQQFKRRVREAKTEFVLINVIVVIIGIMMIAMPTQINNIICQIIGASLCLWGLIKVISYFFSDETHVTGSFAMAQGCALLGFGILFIVNPRIFLSFINGALGVILMVAGVIKLQHAFDYLKLQISTWWIQLIGAVAMAACGIVALTNPFASTSMLMILIGMALVFSGVWDLVTLFRISSRIKTAAKTAAKKEKEKSKYIDVDAE